ncbi:MAG: AraC family transcriptional regulator [Planctomycetia bacterium]
MAERAKEYFRYLAVDPRDQAWGLWVTGGGYQPAAAGADPIPRRRHPPGHFYTWEAGRVLAEFAVVYVTHGAGEFDSQATGSVDLLPGDAALVFPGTWHRYRPRRDTGWGTYWVHYHGEIPLRLLSAGVFGPARAVVRTGGDAQLLDAFRQLLDGLRSGSANCGVVAAAKTMEILARLQEAAAPRQRVPQVQQVIRRARLALEADSAGMPGIEDLVAGSGMSRTNFFRAFKDQTGQSPYAYHLQLTIRRAEEMLRNSTISVKQVAASLGFRNPYHFSKLFKKKTGFAPRAYRDHWQGLAGEDRGTLRTPGRG